MNSYIFNLHISAREYQRLYQGTVKDVLAVAHSGQRVRFPAAFLRPFVTREGVNGIFRIVVDAQNRAQTVEKIDSP